MGLFDIFVAVIWGIVEGITEWLPVSSTGHMILVEEFLKFQDKNFSDMFLVVVQLGAILAVVLLFWERIWPFHFRDSSQPTVDAKIMQMWFKIVAACLPAAIVGVLFDDLIDEIFYNAYVVAGALILYGILFIVVENWNKGKRPLIGSVFSLVFFSFLPPWCREHPALGRRLSGHCFLACRVGPLLSLHFIWRFRSCLAPVC